MGDEQDSRIMIILKGQHQLKYLRLDRHIQGRGGLIRYEHPGLAAHGHGDHGPLAHAP